MFAIEAFMKKNGYVTVKDGTKIFYTIFGSGEPVLFLHGNGGSSHFFQYQVASFKKAFQLVFLDSRGHGRSTNCGDRLDFDLMAEDTKESLDALGLHKVSIVGFSDGANLAMVFAARFPDYVQKLVLNSGNLFFKGTKWYSRLLSYLQFGMNVVLNMLSRRFKNSKLQAKLLLQEEVLPPDELKDVDAPSMVIVGENDVIEESHSKYIASLLPHGHFVEVPREGHNLARTDAPTFNQIVLSFLKGES